MKVQHSASKATTPALISPLLIVHLIPLCSLLFDCVVLCPIFIRLRLPFLSSANISAVEEALSTPRRCVQNCCAFLCRTNVNFSSAPQSANLISQPICSSHNSARQVVVPLLNCCRKNPQRNYYYFEFRKDEING